MRRRVWLLCRLCGQVGLIWRLMAWQCLEVGHCRLVGLCLTREGERHRVGCVTCRRVSGGGVVADAMAGRLEVCRQQGSAGWCRVSCSDIGCLWWCNEGLEMRLGGVCSNRTRMLAYGRIFCLCPCTMRACSGRLCVCASPEASTVA